MRAPTKERLAEKLASAIHDDLATPLLRAKERLRMFSELRVAPTVTVDPQDGSLSFSFDTYAARQGIDATLEELLALPGRLAAERKRRVVLVLDEFQEVMDIDPGLIKLMRSVFQEQGDVAHVYLGSKRHMIERIFNDANEPFWRSAKQMELGPIPPEPFEAFALERFAATGRRLRPATARAALDVTGGHPYATQELLYFLWEEGTLERALQAVLRSEHAHFSLLWERASAAQRLVLEALAAEQPGHPLSSDYQRRHGLPSIATVQTALRRAVARWDRGAARARRLRHRRAVPRRVDLPAEVLIPSAPAPTVAAWSGSCSTRSSAPTAVARAGGTASRTRASRACASSCAARPAAAPAGTARRCLRGLPTYRWRPNSRRGRASPPLPPSASSIWLMAACSVSETSTPPSRWAWATRSASPTTKRRYSSTSSGLPLAPISATASRRWPSPRVSSSAGEPPWRSTLGLVETTSSSSALAPCCFRASV